MLYRIVSIAFKSCALIGYPLTNLYPSMDNIKNDKFGFQFDVAVACGLVNTSIDLINMIKQ